MALGAFLLLPASMLGAFGFEPLSSDYLGQVVSENSQIGLNETNSTNTLDITGSQSDTLSKIAQILIFLGLSIIALGIFSRNPLSK